MRAVLAEHRAHPFEWGVSDCSLFADVVYAITGFDPIAQVRGYDSEITALRALRVAGFQTTADLVRASFAPIDPAHAQRGDLGYPAFIRHPLMSPAVIDGPVAFSKSPGEGWIVFPVASLATVYAV
jgi:hypothetical protein